MFLLTADGGYLLTASGGRILLGSGDAPATLRQAVRSLLADAAGLAAIVESRIYNGSAPSTAVYPRVTFTVVGQTGGHVLAGPDGSAVARVRVSCWSLGGEEAETIADLVKAALDGYAGQVGAVYVENCQWIFEVDQPEPLGGGKAGVIHQILIDFSIDHRAPTGAA
jgi:hypothetical protein